MADSKRGSSQGSLCAPDRFNIDWQNSQYYDQEKLNLELERVFDICHGCRRCVNLCEAFPTLFDMIDEAQSMELEPENHRPLYGKIVEQCYLCDRCYMNKCPYTPPHEWAVDFPHLMLQYKAQAFKQGKTKFRDKVLTSTESVGKFAGIPIVTQMVNLANKNKTFRKILDKQFKVAKDAPVPEFHHKTLRKSAKSDSKENKVVLFTTCYCNYNRPDIGDDLIKVFNHNDIEVLTPKNQSCCGMPKLELGDFETVKKYKDKNIPLLVKYVKKGYKIVAPIPSCVLMFKQELPLMFPEDEDILQVRNAFYDPFEYLWELHQQGKLKTDFSHELGDISYHVACHLEVQNMGLKSKTILELIPKVKINSISRCSGHDGTYAVKTEFRKNAIKIARPVVKAINKDKADYYSSDCPMAAEQLQTIVDRKDHPTHPLSLLRIAYGI